MINGAGAGVASEDRIRSGLYALLARLYADPPDATLLGAIANQKPMPDKEPLPAAWNRLIDASGDVDQREVAQEYTDLFIGVGNSEVSLHASHWLKGFMLGQELVDLRADLQALGIARRASAQMLEDHLSALCECMRLLIEGQGRPQGDCVSTQRSFFDRHIDPWVFRCCDAMERSSTARYYAPVAGFTAQFLALEREALAMCE